MAKRRLVPVYDNIETNILKEKDPDNILPQEIVYRNLIRRRANAWMTLLCTALVVSAAFMLI